MRVRWTPESLTDLKGISAYIERERNLSTANGVCRKIYHSIQMLRKFPTAAESADATKLANS